MIDTIIQPSIDWNNSKAVEACIGWTGPNARGVEFSFGWI